MIQNITLQDFLKQNRISEDTWNESQCNWDTLKSIGLDYEKHSDDFNEAANFFAQKLQKLPKVHSVRWRVKNTEHLLEKIVRKCVKQEEKYKNISCDNYREIVTDLVGVRALHLFKDDCFDIDTDLKKMGSTIETPVVYLREGDNTEKFIEYGFETKDHPAGYRSVHYVLSIVIVTPVVIELQVRTIFEEGWSEIDHRVRYPNFSDDQLVGYFLGIFNRMAGTADEMGSFVIGLTAAHQEYKSQLDEYKFQLDQIKDQITTEKEQTLYEMGETIAELENNQDKEPEKAAVTKIKSEYEKLKTTVELEKSIEDLNKVAKLADLNIFDSYKDTARISALIKAGKLADLNIFDSYKDTAGISALIKAGKLADLNTFGSYKDTAGISALIKAGKLADLNTFGSYKDTAGISALIKAGKLADLNTFGSSKVSVDGTLKQKDKNNE